MLLWCKIYNLCYTSFVSTFSFFTVPFPSFTNSQFPASRSRCLPPAMTVSAWLWGLLQTFLRFTVKNWQVLYLVIAMKHVWSSWLAIQLQREPVSREGWKKGGRNNPTQHQPATYLFLKWFCSSQNCELRDICPPGCWKIELLGLWGGNDSPCQKSDRCGGRPGAFTALLSSRESRSLGRRALSGETPVIRSLDIHQKRIVW